MNYLSICHDRKLSFPLELIHSTVAFHSLAGLPILGDSTFVILTANGKIVGARKTNEATDIPSNAMVTVLDLIVQREMPSVH